MARLSKVAMPSADRRMEEEVDLDSLLADDAEELEDEEMALEDEEMPSPLAEVSDEELMLEMEKRGLIELEDAVDEEMADEELPEDL